MSAFHLHSPAIKLQKNYRIWFNEEKVWWSSNILFLPVLLSVCLSVCLFSVCLSVFCLSLMGPQEQYQYLYKALLSLVSTKENGSGLLTRDFNGTMASMSDQSDQAESMESLV